MKPSVHISCLLLALALLGAASATFSAHEPADSTPTNPRKVLYDVKADAKQQIVKALTKARTHRKHVLLQFGANWCPWCRRLHELLQTDPEIAANLKRNYVVVLIDVDKDHNADVVARYDHPTRLGLPVIVVLDTEGKKLTTQDTAPLEEGDHHNPDKLLAFLKKWSPAR